jgi:outer membrane usher protein
MGGALIFPCPHPSPKAVVGALAAAWLATCLPGFALAAQAGAAGAQPVSASPADALAALSIAINGAAEPGVAYVIRDAKRLLVDRETLTRLHFKFADSDVREVEGRDYVSLDTIGGVRWSINEREQRLDLDVDPDVLSASRLQYALPAPQLAQTPSPGGFLNYNLYGYNSVGHGTYSNSSSLSGAFEAVLFGPYGTGGASFLVNSTPSGGFANDKTILLEAAWRWDDPAKLRTFIVGDSITAPGWWGEAVRFGGVQYSSNFSLQPGYVTYPLLTVSGISTVPTAADIYSNNVRMGTQNVPAGPFSITNVPALSGAGELQVVVSNAFGQQQVITQPFYVTTQLLKPGLSEFSFSAGAERFNYGVNNLDYQGFIGSAFYRYGLNDKLTAQARAEADQHVRAAGVGADYVVGTLGVLSAGVAASNASNDIVGASGNGGRLLLGFSRQASQTSFAVESTWASRNYREIGDSPILQTQLTRASFNVALPANAGSLALAWSGQRFRDTRPPDPSTVPENGPLNILTGTYSVGLGRFGFLTLSASRSHGISNQTQLLALYTLPFGTTPTGPADTTVTLGAQRLRGDGQSTSYGTFDLQRPVPVGEGLGYYVHAQTDHNYTAGVSYYGPYGRYSLEGSSANGEDALRGSIAGGVGVVGNHVFLAAPIEQSFALVEVGSIAGARVLQENIDVGVTAKDGTLILPRLPSYTPVNISIDPLSVPLDASIGETNQKVVTLGRTGLVVRFESHRERNALIRLTLADGSPVPAGATARVVGRSQIFPVAMGGEVYISGLGDQQDIEIGYRGRTCRLPISLEKDSPAVADLGPFVCRLLDTRGEKP